MSLDPKTASAKQDFFWECGYKRCSTAFNETAKARVRFIKAIDDLYPFEVDIRKDLMLLS